MFLIERSSDIYWNRRPPGMDYDSPLSVLNTPIKKIRDLTLNSPNPPSPVRYPSMGDFPVKSDPIFQNMVEKGYSQTISNKVLRELDSRASEISTRLGATLVNISTIDQKKKRYSGIHRPLFSKMESISSHYAASRSTDSESTSPVRDFPSSATKKRRTLNGPEEIFDTDKEKKSPPRKKEPGVYLEQFHTSPVPFLGRAPSLIPVPAQGRTLSSGPSLAAPLLSSPFRPQSSPSRNNSSNSSSSNASSPLKFSRISPSKGSMNLNLLLHGNDEFIKPAVPSVRQSSLQMAGVVHGDRKFALPSSSSILAMLKKPSIPSLQKKSSIPSLQKKNSFASLQKKPSVPTLQKKPSIASLQNHQIASPQRKSAIPSLQKKPSVSSLQKKPSMSSFQRATPTLTKQSSSQSLRATSTAFPGSLQNKLSTSTLNNVTVPKPFSLYDRPTISSSQKSLNCSGVTASSSNRSLNTLQSLASQRSLNRFQKFKSRFS